MKERNKRKTRIVYWVCDKKECKTTNLREIAINKTIYDDICDYCHRAVHEPILIETPSHD